MRYTECDCDGCGAHLVVDHDAVHAFMAQDSYVCTDCDKTLPIETLSAIVADEPLRGVCSTCVIVQQIVEASGG